VVPLVGYPAVWLTAGSHGTIAIALGLLLLVAATATALRRHHALEDIAESAPNKEEQARDDRASALSR
jgi:hypothetical protein